MQSHCWGSDQKWCVPDSSRLLRDWSGHLHADAYSGYDPVIHRSNGLIIEVACWAHARRYFEQALDNDRKLCGLVLEWVRQLYDIEDRASLMSDDERLALRQAESVPILRRMAEWLKVSDDGVVTKNALPEESLTALLPDHWAAAHPKQVLVHRIEEARQVANRKRDDRQKRRDKIAAADRRPMGEAAR